MSDEGLREIHLDGKQLVFLFMTATVVAVVIFLCGVLVGQGVRAGQVRQAEAAPGPAADPTAVGVTDAPIVSAPVEGPRSPSETFTYPELLGDRDVPLERLSASAPPAPRTASPTVVPDGARRTVAEEPVSRPVGNPPEAVSAATPNPPVPSGPGYVVQVAAVRERSEADAMARRLVSKGYPAFVTSPPTGPARIFRVRVGKYPERREAEAVAGRLEKEERFKPWITR